MHTYAFTHTTYSSWAIPHGPAQDWAQPPRKFLEYYNFFCILQRKNWLAIARGKQNWPLGDTRSRVQRRHYFHTAHTRPHSCYDTWETKHSKCSLSTTTHPSIQGFSIWYGFNSRTEAEHSGPTLSPGLNCCWELSDSHLNCMRVCEAEEDWRKKQWWGRP